MMHFTSCCIVFSGLCTHLLRSPFDAIFCMLFPFQSGIFSAFARYRLDLGAIRPLLIRISMPLVNKKNNDTLVQISVICCTGCINCDTSYSVLFWTQNIFCFHHLSIILLFKYMLRDIFIFLYLIISSLILKEICKTLNPLKCFHSP